MAKRTDEDVLDEALEALMLDPAARSRASTELEPLLRIAAGLREMPRPGFKEELAAKLDTAATARRSPKLEAVDLKELLRDLPALVITDATTGEEADGAVRELGWLNGRMLGVMRFSGQTPWERHPDGDELLHILEGSVQITVMTDDGPVRVDAAAGSVFVCPQGLWHRQYAERAVTILYGTPVETSEFSFDEDPRGAAS